MKRIFFVIAILFAALSVKAQETLMFPFQGGSSVMTQFFKDSLAVSPDVVQKKATGTVIMKFTADEQGVITKMIIYYADDYLLTGPVIAALKKSSHHWIIPHGFKTYDFIIQFAISFNPPANADASTKDALYSYYASRRSILTTNQVPLDNATLLPTIKVNYDLQ